MGQVLIGKRQPAKKAAQAAAMQSEIMLLSLLSAAQRDADNLARNMDFINDPMILEDLTHKLKAARTRFRYFLKQTRDAGLCARDFSQLAKHH